jgi:protein disulfide-isomerase A1
VLNEKNFEETIRGSPFILVEFYAPWCGHCKQFAPEYAAAAKQLKSSTPSIPLAKVDATTETKLAEQYGVRGYPTIRLFIDGRDQEYTGGRTGQSVVTWVLKKAGPAAVLLEDAAAAEQFLKDNRLAVVGLFEPGHSTEAFTAAARQIEDVMFAYSTSPQASAAPRLDGLVAPAVRMFFPHDGEVATFTGDLQSVSELETFVRAYRHPAVSIFDGESAPEIFADGRPILFLFIDRNDEKGKEAEKELRQAAAGALSHRRLLISVAGAAEPMDQRLMDYVGVDPEELPTARLVASPMSGMVKYKLVGDLTADSLTSFVGDYEGGRLKPHLKSQEVPESQPGPVFILVGSNFESIVKNPSKDVLVEFYAPWCGHCKKLEPIYREVAKKLEGVRSIVIAKIDATENDVEGVEVEGFPTIKFWRADKKDDPLDYDGDRDVDSFITWLEEKAALPFNKDELQKQEL